MTMHSFRRLREQQLAAATAAASSKPQAAPATMELLPPPPVRALGARKPRIRDTAVATDAIS